MNSSTELGYQPTETRPAPASLREPSPSPVLTPAFLRHLSVEHAAYALALKSKDYELVCLLGKGYSDRQIAEQLHWKPDTATARLYELRKRTGMSRLSLAILGYHLLGDHADGAMA